MKNLYASSLAFVIDATREAFAGTNLANGLPERLSRVIAQFNVNRKLVINTAASKISLAYSHIKEGSSLYVLLGGGICSAKSLTSVAIPLGTLGHSVVSFAHIFNASCKASNPELLRKEVYRSDRQNGSYSFEGNLYAEALKKILARRNNIKEIIFVSHSAGACTAAQIITALKSSPEIYTKITGSFAITPAGMFAQIGRLKLWFHSLRITLAILADTFTIIPAIRRNNHNWLLVIKDSGPWIQDMRDFLRTPARCVNALHKLIDQNIPLTVFGTTRDRVFPLKYTAEIFRERANSVLINLQGNHATILAEGARLALLMDRRYTQAA